MKFNLAEPKEVAEAYAYMASCVMNKKPGIIDIKKVRPVRTLRQNRYLHLLLGAFGAHFGYTLEEAKQIYKEMSPEIYAYELKGRHFLRSSADLDTADMTKTIDRLREKSAEHGCPLPTATDQGWLRAIENDMEHAGYYL